MANPHRHSLSSAKKFGGKWQDYIDIHLKMDCQKKYVPDNRGRVLTHTMFWVEEVMVPLFGLVRQNSDSKDYYVRDVCIQHILEDYGLRFIPTPQDFIERMPVSDWMNNGVHGTPPSYRQILRGDENVNS